MAEDQDQKNQQGGFIAVLHKLEEQFYGPDSPLDDKGRIILYLRHRALRDWSIRKQIGKSEIAKATGVCFRRVEQSLRTLEKAEYIVVTRSKTGKVWNNNIYELHPKFVGTDYVFRPEKPSFRVIYGSKGHKSNPEKVIHTEAGVIHKDEEVPTGTSVGVPIDRPRGVPTGTSVGNPLNPTESLTNSASKNPLKEPIKRTLSERDSFMSENGAGNGEEESDPQAREIGMSVLRDMGFFRRMPK